MVVLEKKTIGSRYSTLNKGGKESFYSNGKFLTSPLYVSDKINNNSSEDATLNYLASILVEAFLDKKENEIK